MRLLEAIKTKKNEEAEKIFSGCSIICGKTPPSRWDKSRKRTRNVEIKPSSDPSGKM